MVCHLISKRFYELVNDKLTDELRGSIPLQATNIGLVVQLVRISACHAEGREFESRPDR